MMCTHPITRMDSCGTCSFHMHGSVMRFPDDDYDLAVTPFFIIDITVYMQGERCTEKNRRCVVVGII